MGIDDFRGTMPEFRPEEFLVGKLEGWAVLESVVGGLQKRATISATGEWDIAAQTIAFTETYTFDDGHANTLHWVIRKNSENEYSGSEPLLEGGAVGEQAGCAFHWKYTREVPQADGNKTKLNFDDWFYRIDDRVCIVRGSAGRAGLPFAIAHVTYRKL
jgi:hypothetical protein